MKIQNSSRSPLALLWSFRRGSLALVLSGAALSSVAGCGKGIQSDLEVTEANFMKTEKSWRFQGTVANKGNKAYSQIFIVADLMEGEEVFQQVATTANVPSGYKLQPGATTSFSQDFDDGGFKPNNYKIVRLYSTG